MASTSEIFTQQQLQLVDSCSPAQLEQRLEDGDSAGAAFICCCELGFTNVGLSRSKHLPTYIVQNLGGSVGNQRDLEALLLEKQINDVVVVGHAGCEIVEYGLRCDLSQMERPAKAYEYIVERTSATRTAIVAKYGHRFDKHVLRSAIEDYVLRELARFIQSSRIIADHLEKDIRLHAWYLKSEDDIAVFDPQTYSFWVR